MSSAPDPAAAAAALAADKAAARKTALAARARAHAQGGAGRAGMLAQVLAGYRGAALAGYMPIHSEIDPRPAMAEAAAHGPVCVPVITAKDQPLGFARWDEGCAMEKGRFGAMVPSVKHWITPEILIVPLVAFDSHGRRLGYGGGFYDRTLEALRARGAALAIGFAYDAQELPDLPQEPTDQPLDMIVTQTRVIEVARG